MVAKVNSCKAEHIRVQEKDNGTKEFKVYAREHTRKSKLNGKKNEDRRSLTDARISVSIVEDLMM